MRPGFFALCLLLPLAAVLAQPVVVTHPTSAVIYPGDSLTLTAAFTSPEPLIYQWRKDSVPIAGANYPTLTVVGVIVPPDSFSSALYDVIATEPAPGRGSAKTEAALVLVTRRPQTITLNVPTALTVAGTSVVLTATASSSLPVTLAFVSGPGSLSGNVVTGTGGGVVVRATQGGNADYAPAEPVERTINFISGALAPFITNPPTDQTVLAGSGVTLRATAIGTPTPTYQWSKDGTAIAGATNATLGFASATLTDAARYTVTVANLAGTATADARLTVRAAPVFVTPPATQTVTAGNAATLNVEVTGFPVPALQWRRNGTAIVGATTSSLAFPVVNSANAATYDVIATNALGTTTSAAATLTVVTRDFTGTYLGRLAGAPGDFALHVRPNGKAAFLAHLPTLSAGVIGLAVDVSLSGQFTATLPLIATPARNVTLRGTINEVAGTTTGTISELNATFDGTRAVPATPLLPQAGLYTAALVGSGASSGYVLVAPDGQAFLLTATGTTVDSARGTLGANGQLSVTTASQITVALTFTNGALRGSVRPPTGAAASIGGAIEGLAGQEHLLNLSVRGVTTPAAPMITGFAIGGTVAKQVLIRAAGPALARPPFNVTGALADPTLQLFRVNTVIGQNDNWSAPAATGTAIAAAATRVGAFPFNVGSADAALLTTLPPGVYSARIEGGTGVVLAEIYEVPVADEAPGSRRLVNVSTIGVLAPDFPLIAGFVISGTAPQRVLIRAAGPTLAGAPFNVAGVLPNPQLTLYRGSAVVRTNDDWFRDAEAALIRDAASRVNAFAFGNQSQDAALLVYLEPGAYTAVVAPPAGTPVAQTTGIALVEIYESNP
jgi:hypothetical protein